MHGSARPVNCVTGAAGVFIRRSQTIRDCLRLDVPDLESCRVWERQA
jgi:hypothetical protein